MLVIGIFIGVSIGYFLSAFHFGATHKNNWLEGYESGVSDGLALYENYVLNDKSKED